MTHEPTPRLQIPDLLARLAKGGGPRLEAVEPMIQGATGAWLVRWPDGRPGVLTWAPPPPPGTSGGLDRALALVDVAWRAGLPAPRYQAVLPLRRGDVVVVQEPAPGVPVPGAPGPGLVDHLLELAERRRGLLRGHRLAYEQTSLSLRADGQGYCLHAPLADHDDRTRALLAHVEAIGAEPGADAFGGEDLVHFDYHTGNVLVDGRDAHRVTAIVDWTGARGGDVALDLAVLAFDVSRRAPDLAARVERRLLDTTAPADVRRIWAHVALRMVDWALRHHPEHLDHWLAVAPRYL